MRHRADLPRVEQNTDLYDEIVKVWPHAKLIGDATTPDGKVYRTLEAVKGGYQAPWPSKSAYPRLRAPCSNARRPLSQFGSNAQAF